MKTFAAAVMVIAAWQVMPPAPVMASQATAGIFFHDLSSLPYFDVRGVKGRGVVGQRGSMMLLDLEAGLRRAPHHHSHEQINFVVAGVADVTVAGIRHRLDPSTATLVPSEVEHFIGNDTGNAATMIEYQPIRRPDVAPPFPVLTFPAAPVARPLPPERRVFSTFQSTSDQWTASGVGARMKQVDGTQGRIKVWELTGGEMGFAPGSESFAFVLQGEVQVVPPGQRQTVHPGTVVQILDPSAAIRFRSASQATVVVFEHIRVN